MGIRIRRGLAGVAAISALAVTVASCTTSTAGKPSYNSATANAPDATNVKIINTDHSAADSLVADAISDIQAYWTKEMPIVFDGKKYTPVEGGFYSVDHNHPGNNVPCLNDPSEIKNNAFFCSEGGHGGLVAFDRTGLIPTMSSQFGRYAVAMVLAHEWGHAIQYRTGGFDRGLKTIVTETQADCYSGAFTRAAFTGQAPHFHINAAQLDEAFAGYLTFSDPPGFDPNSPQAHGNAFDRISSFQEGFDSGPKYCASPKNYSNNRRFTELPYSDSANPGQDQAQGGNSPYPQALSLGTQDLNDFWKQYKAWKPLAGVDKIDPDKNPPSCGGVKLDKTIYYCASNNTIYFDNADAFPHLYEKTGDFAIETMLAIAYGLAARHDFGQSIDDENGLLGAICYAGAYTHSVFQDPAHHRYQLSPGDLDEAVQALLTGLDSSSYNGLQDTTGFQRSNAFQIGVKQGFSGNDPSSQNGGCRQYG